jgi:hypothetical protein
MRRCAWLALWLVVGSTSGAFAEPTRGPALNWVRLPGAEGCITAAELARRVEARLERSVFVLAQDAELAFDGYVQPRAIGGGFAAHLAVSNARGEVLGARDVESAEASCRALDDALVLITALTLFPGDFGLSSGGIPLDEDTNARLHALFGDEPSELDPASLPPAAVAPAAATVPAPRAELAAQAEHDAPRTRVALEAAPVLAIGVLPGAALGVNAELTVRFPELWPVRAAFGHFFERDARAERLSSGSASFERNELMLLLCPVSPIETLAFELCTGAAFGVMSVTSEGFADGGIEASDLVLDLAGQVGARFSFWGGVLARASLTATLPIVQRNYEYQALDAASEPIFRSAQVGLRAQIGVGAEF